MTSGAMKCVKYTLAVFNLIYFAAGIALIVIGSLIATAYQEYFEFFSGKVNMSAIFLISIGVVVSVVSFFGCCGAFKESYGMIVTYMVLIGLVVIVEAAAFVALYVNRDELQQKLKERMELTIPDYNKTEVTMYWNILQKNLHCCGADSYIDWKNNGALNATESVPDTCCVDYKENCGRGAIKSGGDNINKEGCAPRLAEIVRQKIVLIGTLAACLIVIKIIGMILAAMLARSISNEYQNI